MIFAPGACRARADGHYARAMVASSSPRASRTNRAFPTLTLALVTVLALPVAGCWTVTPAASPDGPRAAGDIAWPERDMARARAALSATPRAIEAPRARSVVEPRPAPPAPAAPAPPAPPSAAGPAAPPGASVAFPEFEVAAALRGQGLVRVIDARTFDIEFTGTPRVPGSPPGEGGPVAKVTRRTVDTMYRFVSFSTLPNRPATLSELATLTVMRAGQAAREVAAERRNRPSDADAGRGADVLWEGLAMHLKRPPGTPRGLIVHLGGSNTGELEGRFLDVLLARGWAVLSMPFVGIPGGEATVYAVQTAGRTPSDLYTVIDTPSTKPFLTPLGESARLAINLPGTAEVFATPADFGARVAAITDDRLAEVAYAVEAILAHVEEADPALARLPRVLVGCSAGAMAAPAVAARIPGRFAACVLVGGGANLLDIALRTSFAEARPRIRWATDRDESDQRREAVEAYLSRVALDPVRTAPALRGTRSLVIHATFDAIVPSARGLDLWEALGRPERWNFTGGHLGLFVLLPDQAEPVHEWLVENVPPAAP